MCILRIQDGDFTGRVGALEGGGGRGRCAVADESFSLKENTCWSCCGGTFKLVKPQ